MEVGTADDRGHEPYHVACPHHLTTLGATWQVGKADDRGRIIMRSTPLGAVACELEAMYAPRFTSLGDVAPLRC